MPSNASRARIKSDAHRIYPTPRVVRSLAAAGICTTALSPAVRARTPALAAAGACTTVASPVRARTPALASAGLCAAALASAVRARTPPISSAGASVTAIASAIRKRTSALSSAGACSDSIVGIRARVAALTAAGAATTSLVPVKVTYDAATVAWAAAVVAAGSSYTAAEMSALNDCIVGLKADSVFSKILFWNPCMGADLTGSRVNAVIPSGATTSCTNHNFVSGDYSRSAGRTGNTSNKYLDTGWNAQTAGLDFGNLMLWFYQRTAETAEGHNALGWIEPGMAMIGAENGGGGARNTISWGGTLSAGTNFIDAGSWLTGFWGGGINGDGVLRLYSHGSALGTLTPSSLPSTFNNTLWLHGISGFGGNYYAPQTYTTMMVTTGLSSTDAANLATRIQTLETALGRNV